MTKQSIPRVRRVRLKAGGAQLHVFESARAQRHKQTSLSLRERATDRPPAFEGDLAGYALVCWGSDGSWSADWCIQKDSPVPRSVMPQFVMEKLQQQVVLALFEEEQE